MWTSLLWTLLLASQILALPSDDDQLETRAVVDREDFHQRDRNWIKGPDCDNMDCYHRGDWNPDPGCRGHPTDCRHPGCHHPHRRHQKREHPYNGIWNDWSYGYPYDGYYGRGWHGGDNYWGLGPGTPESFHNLQRGLAEQLSRTSDPAQRAAIEQQIAATETQRRAVAARHWW